MFGCSEDSKQVNGGDMSQDNVAELNYKKESVSLETITNKINKYDSGILTINMLELYNGSEDLEIYNTDKTVYATVNKRELTIGESNFKMAQLNNNLISDKFSVFSFYPDYDILLFDCIGMHENYYKILINNEIKYVQAESYLVSFESYEEHVLNYFIVTNKDNPVRLKPSIDAALIADYREYIYSGISIEGDWVKVRCTDE